MSGPKSLSAETFSRIFRRMSVTYAEIRNDDNDTREKSQLFELYFLSNLLFLPSSLLRDLAAAARNVYGQMADKTERLCIRNRNPIRLERERERES